MSKLSDKFPKARCLVINLCGTNGAGKTTAMAYLLKKFGVKSVSDYKGEKRCIVRLNRRVAIIGKLSADGDYRGCDGINDQILIRKAVLRMVKSKNKVVLFEGIMPSHVFSSYVDLARKVDAADAKMMWLFLDTPLGVCLKRVKHRRGLSKRKNPVSNKMGKGYESSLRTAKRDLDAAGIEYEDWMPLHGITKHRLIGNMRLKLNNAGESTAVLKHKRAEKRLYAAVASVLKRR